MEAGIAGAGAIVGRERELGALADALTTARGSAHLVLMTGEAGMGKTRLLDELADDARAAGVAVFAGRAAEFERGLPYALLDDALGRAARADADALLERLDAPLGAQLRAMLPVVVGERTAAPVIERHHAHRAIAAALEVLGGGLPVLLALDDLHWADDASADLLATLVRRLPDAPLLLALAARPAGLSPRIVAAAADAERRGACTLIELGPLSDEESAALVSPVADGARASHIVRRAAGNPFFLKQLAQSRAGSSDLPNGAANAVLGDVELLPADARRVLEAAAVVGDPFDVDVVIAVAAMAEADVFAHVDRLHRAGLVRPSDVPRRFEFRHPLVRQAVYDEAPVGRRIAAHERAAAALERQGAPPVARAHHVEQAARPGDAAAVALLEQAAEAAVPVAPATAARFLRSAIRLLPGVPDEPLGMLPRLRALADALVAAGDLEEARETLVTALRSLPPGAAAERVVLETTCAGLEQYLGRPDLSRERLRRALGALPDGARDATAALQLALAVDAIYALRWAEVQRHGAEAAAQARELGDDGAVAAALAVTALGLAATGPHDPALVRCREAAVVVDGMPDEQLAGRLPVIHHLAWAETFLDRYDDALRHLRRGIALGQRMTHGQHLVPLLVGQMYPLNLLGRVDEAIEIGEEAVAIARSSGHEPHAFWALWELAEAYFCRGDLDTALRLAEESDALRRHGPPNLLTAGEPGWCRAMVLWAQGGYAEGLAVFEDAVGGPDAPNVVPAERPIAFAYLAAAHARAGEVDLARRAAQSAEETARRVGRGVARAHAALGQAHVLLAAGDGPAAAAAARAACALFAGHHDRLDAGFALAVEAEALARTDDHAAARQRLDDARQHLSRHGSALWSDALVHALARWSGTAASDGEDGHGLTEREREVAALVARGLTNREVGEALALSVKTVETHLRNVFAKLEVSSRGEVGPALRGRADARRP